MKTQASASDGFVRLKSFLLAICGMVLMMALIPLEAATDEPTSFSPIFVKDGSGKLRTLTWTYVVNGGQPLEIADGDASLGDAITDFKFKCGDLQLTINPLTKTRVATFSGSLSGYVLNEENMSNSRVTGTASAKTTEALAPLDDEVLVNNQQMTMGINLSIAGQGSVAVAINMLNQFDPSLGWFLDRSDLDQLDIGDEWYEEATGTITGSLKLTIPGYGSETEPLDDEVYVSDLWRIVDKLDSFMAGGVTYHNVVVVERETEMPTGDLSGTTEPVVMTYWVAKGVGMVKGLGQYRIMNTPLEIVLKSSTLVLPVPTITWANPAPIGYGAALAPAQLNARANVTGSYVYTPPLGTKLPLGVHTLSVAFTPSDSAHYANAQKSVSLTVNKAAVPVVITGLAQVYNGQPRVVTATTVPAGLKVNVTYGGASDAPLAPGTYPVVATVEDDNYMGSKTANLVVAKAPQTINFPTPPPLRFGDADYLLTASSTSGLPVSYVSSTPAVATIVDGNKLHITGAGKVTITASQAGEGNWLAAARVPKALMISKQSQTIDFPVLGTPTVGDPDMAPGATATSGLPVVYASATPQVATIVNHKIHLIGKGQAVITATQLGNASWDPAMPVKQTLTVAGKPQSISFPPIPDVGYGTADFAAAATASSGLIPTYTSDNPMVATIVAGRIHITGVGTCIITAKQAGNAQWAAAPDATQVLTVPQGMLPVPVITWPNPVAITYGTALAPIQLNAKANVPGSYVYTPPLGTKLPVGVHTLSVAFTPTDPTHYTNAQKSVTLTVNKAAGKILLAGLVQTYNGTPRVVTATTLPPGLKVDITYNGSADAPVNAGMYPVVATIADESATGSVPGILKVAKGNQTISFASLQPLNVGAADRVLTASAASGLPVAYASSTPAACTIVDGNKLHAVAAGAAFITASQPGDSNWNAALPVRQLLTVEPPLVTLDIPAYAGFTGTRTYKWTENGVVDTWSTQGTGITTAEGKQVYFIQEYDADGKENDQSYLLADTSEGLFQTGGLNDNGQPTEATWYWTPRLPLLMKPFVLGKEYPVSAGHTSFPGTTFTGKMKTVTERVSVPHGTFDTYKVTLILTGGGKTRSLTCWYAMNLGLIKRIADGSLWEMTGYAP